MPQINVNVDDEILRHFRDVIYNKYGLKKGDFKKAVEEAIADYVKKYSAPKK